MLKKHILIGGICIPIFCLCLLTACESDRQLLQMLEQKKQAQTAEEVIIICEKYRTMLGSRVGACESMPFMRPAVSTENLNVRSTSSVNAQILTTINKGEKIEIHGHRGLWLAVTVWPNGFKASPVRGWVHSRYVKLLGPVEGREHYSDSFQFALSFFWVSENWVVSLVVLAALLAIEIGIAASAENPFQASLFVFVLNFFVFGIINFFRVAFAMFSFEGALFVLVIAIVSTLIGSFANSIAEEF